MSYADKTNLLFFKDDAGQLVPVTNVADWSHRRVDILLAMQEVMGPLPDETHRVPLDVQIVEEIKTEHHTRKKLSFAVEAGDRVAAYLFIPVGQSEKMPAVVCPHPTSKKEGKRVPAGLAGKPDRHYAVHLAERGYVTIAPDYPMSGESTFDPYAHGYASATMKAIWNHMRAVDLLAALPEVDADRIGVLGHSLGGHNSIFLGAFDQRIKCIVSNCGYNSFFKYRKGFLKDWSHAGYMPRIKDAYHDRAEEMPFDFTEVIAALAPRPFLGISPVHDADFEMDGACDCMFAATPVYKLLGAPEKLGAIFPNCDHNFPDDVRADAYAWLDRWLKPPASRDDAKR